jgi:hypothetical protein
MASTLERTLKSPSSDDTQTHVIPSIELRAEKSQPAKEPHSNKVLPFLRPRDYRTPLTTTLRKILGNLSDHT